MAIDNIHSRGGQITSFKTCSGNFIPDEVPDNPFKFRLSQTAAELLAMGRQTNRYLVDGHVQQVPLCRLFEQSRPMPVPNVGPLRVIPEGDALYYRSIYDLANAHTVARGKIYPEGFEQIWNVLVRLGLNDPLSRVDLCADPSFLRLLDSLLPYAPSLSLEQRLTAFCDGDRCAPDKFRWLGLLDEQWIEGKNAVTPALVLEYLLERKLCGVPEDRDCVIMRHDIEYEFRNEQYRLSATFTSTGDDLHHSALARTIGYMCGAAAKSVLLGTIALKGVHIPVIKEIYDPLLNELEDLGIAFQIDDHKMCAQAAASGA
jgi:saccharopine dehydrogenase (NADP+, L-glutamate forming)